MQTIEETLFANRKKCSKQLTKYPFEQTYPSPSLYPAPSLLVLKSSAF
jgi:hypothetical protein